MVKAQEASSRGFLQINVVNIQNNFPIQNATVSIRTKGEPDRVLEEVKTNPPARRNSSPFLHLRWNTA